MGFYCAAGLHDAPGCLSLLTLDHPKVASAVLVAPAGARLSDIETTVAITAKDAAATFEAAG